jgi:hypothetical protein
MHFNRFAVLTMSLVLVVVPISLAQMETATLSGKVTDQKGAIVGGAQLIVTNIETNISVRGTTNQLGLYVVSSLKPGHYRVSVSKEAFKTINLSDLVLTVQDAVSRNFELQVGSVSESVTVVADAADVRMSPAVTTVVDPKLVSELPLNGRSFQGLIQLTPGVVTAPTDNNSQGQFSINGQRTNANYYMVDGASANTGTVAVFSTGQTSAGGLPSLSALGGTNTLASTEAVQEFAVQTSSYAAELGRTPGGQISIVTRSGTNQFHGAAFNYLRNDLFDANDWFADHNGIKRLALRQNDFGGVFGGPLRSNKTFFFFSYEGLRLRLPQTGQSDVPTLAARAAAPGPMQPFFNAYPLPTGADEGSGLAPAVYGFSNPSTLDTTSLRIDHHVGQSLFIFGRYNYAPSKTQQRGGGESLNTLTNTQQNLHTLTLGVTYLIRPTITEDARFNWSRAFGSSFFSSDNFGGSNPLPTLFPGPFTTANSQQQVSVALQARNGILAVGRNIENVQHQINFVDNVAWQTGSHLVKMGVDYRRLTPQTMPVAYGQIAFFSTVASADAMTADAGQVLSESSVSASFDNYSLYVQDNWRPMVRLSVVYGLRWDYNPTPSARGSNGLAPAVVQNINDFPNLSLAPNGTALYHATVDNVAPRFGFAYQLRTAERSQTVVRAGAGTFYDLGQGPVGGAFGATPFQAITNLSGHTFPYSSTDAAPPATTLNPPFARVYAFPKPLRTPYTYQWNLSVEQSLGANQTFTVGYVGAVGHSLVRSEFFLGGEAGLSSNFQQVISIENAGFSKYNALQAQFRRRAASGLTILASYTFAHSLDNVSTDSNFGSADRFLDPRRDYGSSDFDIRHTGSAAIDYDLPGGGNSLLARALLHGWSIDPVLTVRSSPPVDVIMVRDIGFGFTLLRPDLVSGVPLYLRNSGVPGGQAINPAVLAVPAQLRQGNLKRNFFRGFPLFQGDFALRRHFRLTEKLGLQVRVDAFNVFNHPNFSPEANDLGFVVGGSLFPTPGFGVSSSMLASGLNTVAGGTGFSPLYQIGGPRSLQFGLKLEF